MLHTKRPHHKTRSGCRSCKKRRVKCDELRPQCTACSIRNADCEYLDIKSRSTSVQPVGAVSLIEGGKPKAHSPDQLVKIQHECSLYGPATLGYPVHIKQADLRLMHHYYTVTTTSLSITENDIRSDTWRKEVPQLAFEHDFLLDNLLAFASIHLYQLAPQPAEYQTTAIYLDKALRGYRNAIQNLSVNNFLAVLVTSAMMSPCSLAVNRGAGTSGLWTLDWLYITKGVGTIIEMATWEEVEQSPVAPIFTVTASMRESTVVCIPTKLQQMLDTMESDAEADIYYDIILQSVLGLGKIYGGLKLHGIHASIALETLCWQFIIPKEFTDLVRQKQPHALIVLAHFVTFFEFLPNLWWAYGVTLHEIDIISSMLSSEWQSFIEIPRKAIKLRDKEKIAELLLTQLPPLDEIRLMPMEPFFINR